MPLWFSVLSLRSRSRLLASHSQRPPPVRAVAVGAPSAARTAQPLGLDGHEHTDKLTPHPSKQRCSRLTLPLHRCVVIEIVGGLRPGAACGGEPASPGM